MRQHLRWGVGVLLGAMQALQPIAAVGETTDAGLSARLLQSFRSLQPQLQNNAFGQPLVLQSSQHDGQMQGEIFAVVDFAQEQLSANLDRPSAWCDVMILHLNTKYCAAVSVDQLWVQIGKKSPQALSSTDRLDFHFQRQRKSATELQISLQAAHGPWGTSDYRIVLESVALNPGQSFVHLTYAYKVGLAGQLAFASYLATVGRDKVGFSRQDDSPVSGPNVRWIGGVRGLMERNTMRYYLAIGAYLRSLALPAGQQTEARLQDWFQQTERYARQLHEMERASYLEMKHAEILRLRSTAE